MIKKIWEKLLDWIYEFLPLPEAEIKKEESQKNISVDFWNTITHFCSAEFDSPDQPGSGKNMDHTLIRKLDEMRKQLNMPINITSGYRTKSYNKHLKTKGYKAVPNSSHLIGKAVDIAVPNPYIAYKIVDAAMGQKIGRIFVSTSLRYCHIDIDDQKTQGLWGK